MKPYIGQTLHLYESKADFEGDKLPLAAMVTHITDDGKVNVAAWNPDGGPHQSPPSGLSFVEDDKDIPDTGPFVVANQGGQDMIDREEKQNGSQEAHG